LRSWNEGWIEAPRRVGAKLSSLIGAQPDEVLGSDSTSINLFKLLAGALRLRPGRRVILTEADNFPTDLYIAQGLADLLGVELRAVPRHEIANALDETVAVLTLTHVNYATAERYDMQAITAAAHEAGALVLWDLSHSAGAVPLDLNGWAVDLAIGSGYKFLNGGPGSPAFLFVSRAVQADIGQPVWGWMGHATPFAFADHYVPAPGVSRFLTGTPHMVSMAALEGAIDLWLQVDLAAVWRKSRALSELMIRLVDEHCAPLGVRLGSPREPERRGSHLALLYIEGYPVMRALIARGVIGDFRPPDLMRFAITPLYLRYVDVWDAVMTLRDILDSGDYHRPEYRARKTVT
jgi:kynureninase